MFRLQGIFMAITFPRFQAKIRMSMLKILQGHSYNYFINSFSGNLSNKINDMAQSATDVLRLFMTLFLPVGFAFILATGFFFIVNPFFSLLLFFWILLHMTICFIGARQCVSLSNIHATSRSSLTGKVVDSLSNIVNVMLFSKRHFELRYLGIYQKEEQKKHLKSLMYVEKIKIWLGLSSLVFPGVLMTWYVIYSWQMDKLSIGDVIFIFNTTANIMMIAWYAGLELPNLFKEFGVCKQALSILKDKTKLHESPKASILNVHTGDISFDNVSFGYTGSKNIFNSLNLKIDGGTKVGLVGISGAGKSSFVKLIMRLYDVNQGRILIDNQDISKVTLHSLRESISMIPQEPTLFHRTLLDNIRYAKDSCQDAEAIEASKKAKCHDFILNLKDGYQSYVGERGIKLSGGQRQRLAIARIVLKDSPILILDEPTSALDSLTESYLQENLRDIMKDKTSIVIAHRLSTLKEMDRLLVFKNGDVVEDGTHNELLKKSGLYSEMWQMQVNGFIA